MECIQLSLSGKMFPELSAQTAEKISEPCWKNLPTRHNQTFQFLDLRGGDGARPEQSSETAGLWHGGCSTLNVGECPSVESVYTYDDEHRPDPADTKRVDKDFSAAMKKLYRMCDKKGIRHPKWIVVHEYSTYVDGVWVGKHHHHVIMQRVYGLTREMVEEAWSGRGMARCEPLHFDHGYITSLAKYIMKNVRCKRHWRQSRGLKPPKMPRPNDGKMSRTKLKDVCENRLEDRAYTKAKTDQNINTAVDAHNSADTAHGDIRASVAAMRGSINAIELKFGTNVTKNPFSATFSSLDGLTVTGVWNAEQARVEF